MANETTTTSPQATALLTIEAHPDMVGVVIITHPCLPNNSIQYSNNGSWFKFFEVNNEGPNYHQFLDCYTISEALEFANTYFNQNL